MMLFLFFACASEPAYLVQGEIFWSDNDISGSLSWYSTLDRKPNKNRAEQPCRTELLSGERESCESCLMKVNLIVEESSSDCEAEFLSTPSYYFRFDQDDPISWYAQQSSGWEQWGEAEAIENNALRLEGAFLFLLPE